MKISRRSGSGMTSFWERGSVALGFMLIHDFGGRSEKVSVETDKIDSLF